MQNTTFQKIKNSVLGKNYDLSVAIVSTNQMRRAMKYKKMNPKEMRKKAASNVLAFPLSKASGEILICKETAKKEAPLYGMSQKAFLSYLFIHGLYHLKGYRHSATMERIERRTFRKFGFKRNE